MTSEKPPAASQAASTIFNVIQGPSGWKILKNDAEKPFAVLVEKADAVHRAKELAKKSKDTAKVRVHKKDGTFEIEYIYHKTISRRAM
jgi:uncharacterized protein DUF2188